MVPAGEKEVRITGHVKGIFSKTEEIVIHTPDYIMEIFLKQFFWRFLRSIGFRMSRGSQGGAGKKVIAG